jgi:hypothetical protein
MSMMGSQAVFPTNGETIFRTGRNQQGVIMQDLARSQMPMPPHWSVACIATACRICRYPCDCSPMLPGLAKGARGASV